jgi:hypothetical protein
VPIILPIAFLFLAIVALSGAASAAPSTPKRQHFTGKRKGYFLDFDVVGGRVTTPPSALQAAMTKKLKRTTPVPMDVVALATVIPSEGGGLPESGKIAIAWAVKNMAKKTKKTLFAVIAPDGQFASQGTINHSYVASSSPPGIRDLAIAADVVAGKIADNTGGATLFDSPAAQRKFLAEGLPGYKSTPEEIAANRRAKGYEEVRLASVSPEALRLWRAVA